MKALGVLLLKSVGAGYGAVNIAGRNENLRVLEFAPLGMKSQILVMGPHQDIQSFITSLRTADIERSRVFEKIDEKVLQSYVGQNLSKMKDFLLILESCFVGDLFQYAQEFLSLGLDAVDFRVQRMNDSPGFLIMTGTDSEKIKRHAQDLKQQNVKITYLPNLSKGLRNYLDVVVEQNH